MQIVRVFFMDIFRLAGLLRPGCDEPVCYCRIHVQEHDPIRDRQSHLRELQIPEPVQKFIPILCIRQLDCLMDHVTRRVTVGQDDISRIIEFLPLHTE